MPGGGGSGPIQLPGMMGGPRNFKTGTGRLRGRVLASDGTGPIRRAQCASRVRGLRRRRRSPMPRAASSFANSPAGHFTLQADKSAFVSVQYGQTGRSNPASRSSWPTSRASTMARHQHAPRQRHRRTDHRRVRRRDPDVSVTAMRQTWQNGRRHSCPLRGRVAQTNDLGHFRIYGLPPGDYYVSATLRSGGLEMVDLELMAGTAASNSAGPTASAPKSGYSSTYYPGTPNIAEAQRIHVGRRPGVPERRLCARRHRLAKVSGIVIGSDGKPLRAPPFQPSRRIASSAG